MNERKNSFFFIALISFFSALFNIAIINYFFFKKETNKSKPTILSATSTNETISSLFVGEFRFTLYGYTSPSALVTLSGLGIFDTTIADNDGFFIFKNRFSPFSPREACLSAQDQLGRVSSQLCLPKFPINYNVEIGPVILPPTISLNQNQYWVGESIIISGQTFPNSDVELWLFEPERKNNFLISFSPIRPVFASKEQKKTIKIKTRSDEYGNYAFKFNQNKANKFKFVTNVNIKNAASPLSRKLSTNVFPWWMKIFRVFFLLFELTKNKIIEILIIVESIFLIFITKKKLLHPSAIILHKRKTFALISYPKDRNIILFNKN